MLAMAETASHEVLSERTIEELWKVRINENSSALEEISTEMKSLLDEPLRRMGISLLEAKAFNFSFKNDGLAKKEEEIVNMQISAWSMEWEKQNAILLADGKAEADASNRRRVPTHILYS